MTTTLLVLTAVIALLPTLQQVEGLQCYISQADSASPTLPIDAKMENCTWGETFCAKLYKKTVTKENGIEVKKVTMYQWSCAQIGKLLSGNIKNGGAFEFGTGSGNAAKSVFEYARTCVCDGDNCNGAGMNTKCNEEPVYTHQCYSDDEAGHVSDPHLPADAIAIPCTATQSCVKYSHYINVTDDADYQWGCMTMPKTGQCDYSASNYDPSANLFEKVCMCCGDKCNGHQLDTVTADNEDCGSPYSAKCYRYSGSSPVLPIGKATVETCGPRQMCMKGYTMDVHKENGVDTRVITYNWGCADFGTLFSSTAKCGAVLEFGTGSGSMTVNDYEYKRFCHCCGDLCNDALMDGTCNDEPVFTHECYSGDSGIGNDNPHLPTDAVVIPCTATQSCAKYSHYENETDHADYQWACFSTPDGKCDWSGSSYSDGNYEKACACCGDKCNGHQVDSVVASDSNCNTAVSRKCYTYTQVVPSMGFIPALPENAPVSNCIFGESMCMKMYTKTLTYDDAGKETKEIRLTWGCAHFAELLMTNAKCDGTLEVSTGTGVTKQGVATVPKMLEYRRACLCCGDRCNNGYAMDSECNNDPAYTHKCYSAGTDTDVTDPALPDNAVPIECTANQACLKYSHYVDATPAESDYQWACVTAPEGKCDHSATGTYGDKLEKACMCCGDRCNGLQMDSVQAKDKWCKEPEPPALQCYTASSTSPYLPVGATLQTCSFDETMCMKSHVLTTTKDGSGVTITDKYIWGCALFDKKLAASNTKCNSTLEISTGHAAAGKEVSTYTQTCTCCGTDCNDGSMDGKCNKQPTYTHECHAMDREVANPSLPADAIKVECTQHQACFKYSKYYEDAHYSGYQWGCSNPPAGTDCNFVAAKFDIHSFEKACMCCGDSCNGQAYDSVLASEFDCKGAAKTTPAPPTKPTAPTPIPTTTEKDNTDVIIVGAVLGSVLGVTLITLVIVIVGVCSKKSSGSNNIELEVRGK